MSNYTLHCGGVMNHIVAPGLVDKNTCCAYSASDSVLKRPMVTVLLCNFATAFHWLRDLSQTILLCLDLPRFSAFIGKSFGSLIIVLSNAKSPNARSASSLYAFAASVAVSKKPIWIRRLLCPRYARHRPFLIRVTPLYMVLPLALLTELNLFSCLVATLKFERLLSSPSWLT